MPTYRIDNLTKRFGDTLALGGITFDAAQGEFLVVLGPTGAGKTTLLRTIAGLERPDAGDIFEDGQSLADLSPAQRDIAMVFQNFSLYPRLTVFDNLAFPLRPRWRNIGETEVHRRVTWAADLLGLTPKLQSRPTELSGGQQQRVAIGRAIVREPRLFLFDEPLASLDAKLRESMTIEIHRLQRRLNVTMLYITHDQTEALSLADRIVVLDHGRVLQIGTPEQIYRQPASPRVARMLGSPPVNLLASSAATALLPVFHPSPAPAATIGIRPENLQLRPDMSGPAVVRVVEHLGPITVAYLIAQSSGKEIELRSVLGPAASIKVGDRCQLTADPAHILTWDS